MRVPFYTRWPGKFQARQRSDAVSVHIDILPTVLEACDIPRPKGLKIDGVSRLTLLRGDEDTGAERVVFQQ